MPMLAFARAADPRSAVPVSLSTSQAVALTVHQSNVLVDSTTASAGALDPQTSPVKAIVRRTRSDVQRRHAVLNLGP